MFLVAAGLATEAHTIIAPAGEAAREMAPSTLLKTSSAPLWARLSSAWTRARWQPAPRHSPGQARPATHRRAQFRRCCADRKTVWGVCVRWMPKLADDGAPA